MGDECPMAVDIPALQQRLRTFAAERDWASYLTPKNLAMAMMVEAAELLEIFQWLTPEESMHLGDDPERLTHLGEEIADVLVYLVQIADRSGVEIGAAVERKLALNAKKYPIPVAAAGRGDVIHDGPTRLASSEDATPPEL